MLKIVVDTNIWIRCLLGGRTTFPILRAWRAGDGDLRADDRLRSEMAGYGIELWGVETLLARLEADPS